MTKENSTTPIFGGMVGGKSLKITKVNLLLFVVVAFMLLSLIALHGQTNIVEQDRGSKANDQVLNIKYKKKGNHDAYLPSDVIKVQVPDSHQSGNGLDNNNSNNGNIEVNSNNGFDMDSDNGKFKIEKRKVYNIVDDSGRQYYLDYYNYYITDPYPSPHIKHGDTHRYNVSGFKVPSPNPMARPNIPSQKSFWKWISDVENDAQLTDEERSIQLTKLEHRRIESETVESFYEHESKLSTFEELKRTLREIEFQPIYSLPFPNVYPQPIIPAPYLFQQITSTVDSSVEKIVQENYGDKSMVLKELPAYNEYYHLKNMIGIVGQFKYGIHNYYERMGIDTSSYITILTDPVERVISHYYKEKKTGKMNLDAIKYSLKDWVIHSPRGQNYQARVLSGIDENTESVVSNESFRMALYHLRKMKFVGLTERFKESIILMKYYCGFTKEIDLQEYKRNNSYPEVPQHVLDFIREKNQLDIYLYEEGIKMFERQMDIIGRDTVARELEIMNSHQTIL